MVDVPRRRPSIICWSKEDGRSLAGRLGERPCIASHSLYRTRRMTPAESTASTVQFPIRLPPHSRHVVWLERHRRSLALYAAS